MNTVARLVPWLRIVVQDGAHPSVWDVRIAPTIGSLDKLVLGLLAGKHGL